LDVAAQALTSYSVESLGVLWPALAAMVGATLDRRGTARLATFTRAGRVGSRIQLSGGWQVVRARDRFEVRRLEASVPEMLDIGAGVVDWDRWVFRPEQEVARPAKLDVWTAWLPTDRPLRVRAWKAGDAMVAREGGPARKVKELLSDAGVTGYDRSRWPVVLAGDEIVWIPGVSRSDAATERSGRPGLALLCEYNHH
jgi:tRNA(Ile)-lysidine synthase